MSTASPIPMPSRTSASMRGDQSEVIQAVAGLGIAALDHLIAVVVSRRYSADPARILPALRPTTEELVLIGPLVWLLFSRVPRRAQVWIAVGVLGVWFASRIALAAQAGSIARTLSVDLPKQEPPPVPPPRWQRRWARVRSLWR